ncbi:glycosyltransferase [Microbacterium sp. ARD32]|uniref:glycosyltransferase n=1 Tax=Microbacterium sp. ARD32 TaxID=2962577 RepID=UPI0028828872|nr:nucleotide disphospho-sugar-binding domain-containing protein [Microbacterium sp. ARD32]MDT0157908.1 glycosyltransferase [Microbacterium sp. ARD32]
MSSTSYRAPASRASSATPMSLLICCTPVHGHVLPLLSVTRTLVQAGHDVRFLTGIRYRTLVEQAGAQWVPLPAEADYDDRDMDRAFPGRVGRRGVDGARWDLRNIFLEPAPAQLRAVDEQLRLRAVDAVLAESMFLGAMLLLCRPASARPPVINLGIVPLGLRSRDTAPFALGIPPLPGPFGRLRNSVMNAMTDRFVFAELQRDAERMALAETGAPLPTAAMNYPALADAVMQFTVESFEYPRSDLAVPVHFVGPVSVAAAGGAGGSGDLPDWWDDLDGRRVVHVTQGTVANGDLGELVLPTLAALADEDVLVVVSTGGRPVPPSSLPANARIAEYLPYDRLFPRLDAFVTNGGYGGVHHSLARGVPIVAAGSTEDKAEVSARVAWSGAGLRVRRVSADSIRTAVRRVLHEPSFRENAARLGAEIAAAPGPAGIESVLRGLRAPVA